jgi:excisionase family DNA binding protein
MLQAAGEFSSILVEAQEDHHMAIDDRLYTIAEVAQYLGMSKDTITTWVKAGRLKASRIGRFWRIRPRDLEAFLDAPPPRRPRPSASARRHLP